MPAASRNKSASVPSIRTAEEWLRLRPMLEALVTQYQVPSYIGSDPIQFPHRYRSNPKACELVGFIAALLSYGRRDLIIATLNRLFLLTENDPSGFLEAFHSKKDARLFEHFVYRFNKGPDLVFLWERLQWAYREYGSLETLFLAGLDSAALTPESSRLKVGMARFLDALLGDSPPVSYGLKFLFAHPEKGGACKRLNMFLRWMVRRDAVADVDFGLWRSALTPADLLVPLDTHIAKMNARLGFSHRTDGSWQTAEEITAVFRALCPHDPVRYDYALFGFSLDRRSPDEILDSLRELSHTVS